MANVNDIKYKPFDNKLQHMKIFFNLIEV